MIVVVGALLLFLTTVTMFDARPTDISALRVLDGDVPYRDFWTMYAPGSYVTLAGAYAVLGRELVVSNLLGILVSAASVGVLHRIVAAGTGRALAFATCALAAMSFYAMGYHDGLGSYPPTVLLVLTTVLVVSRRCTREGVRWAVVPGLLLGTAALYKHDIAAYAAVAVGVGTLVARRADGRRPLFAPVLLMGAVAAAVPLLAGCLLVALGAGPDLREDLFRFPMEDFEHVRGEYFPLIPTKRGGLVKNAQELRHWGLCNIPTVALLVGAVLLVRHRRDLSRRTAFVATAATVAYCFHWVAAHVQINTNAISLTIWGSLVGVLGVSVSDAPRVALVRRVVVPALLAWGLLFLGEPVYMLATRPLPTEPVGVPGLRGIRVPPERAVEMRELAAAIADAAPPDAPLLFVSHRNDTVVYAQSVPFWLSRRRAVTLHHEVHPGVTDVERFQRRMLADIAAGPRPVVVREYRFSDATIERMKGVFGEHVPVGSTLLDDWIAATYEPGPRFGSYEVMRPREP